jgi:hypothetical protein
MNKTNIKGLQMSKLDITQQETLSLNVNQIQQDLPNIHDASLNEVDEDLLQAWREVFKEDKVQVLEVCC